MLAAPPSSQRGQPFGVFPARIDQAEHRGRRSGGVPPSREHVFYAPASRGCSSEESAVAPITLARVCSPTGLHMKATASTSVCLCSSSRASSEPGVRLVLIRKEERRGQGPRRISIPKIKVDSRNQRVDLQNPG